MGLFVIYFGSKVKYEKIAHHTIILSKRYKELLSDIFNGSKLPEDFSYIYIDQLLQTHLCTTGV